MSFGEEWAGLVAGAREKQSTSMQLNGAGDKGGDPGGGKDSGKWLQVTDDLLRDYAKKVRQAGTAFQRVDNAAMRETEQVPGSMKGFASDEAFKEFQKMWRDQMTYLQKRYAGVASALTKAAGDFKETDAWSKAEVERIEKEQREKEGKQPETLNDLLLKPVRPSSPTTPELTPSSPLLYPPSTDKPVYGPYVPTNKPLYSPFVPTDKPTSEPGS